MTGKNDTPSPPQWMDKLLEWFCAEEFLEIVQGDLHELYHRDVKERGRSKAKLHYLLHVLDLFRPFALGFSLPDFHYLTSTGMYKNYFITAWRNFRRQLGFAMINILGLAIGMAAFMIILTYVSFELSYDEYLPNKNQLLSWKRLIYKPDGTLAANSAKSSFALTQVIREEMPEVADVARLHRCSPQSPYTTISHINEKDERTRFNEKHVFFADAAFLPMFDIKILVGDTFALREPHTLLLSASTAARYFGVVSDDIIGQTLQIPYPDPINTSYTITGIFQDLPPNSHLQADMLLSYQTLTEYDPYEYENRWMGFHIYIYTQLHPSVTVAQFRQKMRYYITRINERYQAEDPNPTPMILDCTLLQVDDVHLQSTAVNEIKPTGNVQTVYFLFIIGCLVILIAWINYVNLTTARAVQRAKEVGVRKVVGASRGQLIFQFLAEAQVINLLATLIAFFVIWLSLPFFRQLTGTPLSFHLWWEGLPHEHLFFLVLGMLFLFSTLFSGFYPALVLSSFKPLKILRGRLLFSSTGRVSLRSALVVIQFTMSVILIAGTYLMYQQMEYMQNQPLGFDDEQMLIIQSPSVTELKSGALEVFKEELLQESFVEEVTASSMVPGLEYRWGWSIGAVGKPGNNSTQMVSIDHEFLDVYDLEITVGRNFSKDYETDKDAVLINETLADVLDFENAEAALHQKVLPGGGIGEKEVVGIVKDFHQSSLKEDFSPICFLLEGTTATTDKGVPYDFKDKDRAYLSVKISTNDLQENIEEIEDKYRSYFPGFPIQYFFLDERFNQQYKADMQFSKVFSIFAGLAIFIACLGILGLSSYMAVQKSKEIGIRKVLGATVGHIVLLLSSKFVRLVLLAIVIALPVAYFLFDRWLENYAFRIDIGWWFFVVPALAVIVIAIMAISVQTLKAALANPVDSIKYE